MRNVRRFAGAGIAAAAILSLAACGGEEGGGGDAGNQDTSQAPTSSMMESPTSESSAAGGEGVTTASDVYGPACGKVPTEGPGSVSGMIDDPVATAASNNPLLEKLTAAVEAAKLGDTLNSAEALTVFAPANAAFDALGEEKFKELASNPDQLAPILTYHVVPQRYDREGLIEAGTVETLNTEAGPLKIEGEGENMTVNGVEVLCGNVPTANATVFVIGEVLTPGTNKE